MARFINGTLSEYLTGPLSPLNFERTDAFSGHVWVNQTATAVNGESIFGHLDPGANYQGWELFQQGDTPGGVATAHGLCFFLINTYSTNTIQRDSNFVLTTGVWTPIGFTYDGSSTGAGVTIYANGVSQTCVNSFDSLSATIKNTTNLQFGRRTDSTAFYNGGIAHAAVWRGVLTGTEMLQLAWGALPEQIRPKNLMMWFPFEHLGGPFLDYSVYANLALVGNGTSFIPNNPRTVARRPLVIMPKTFIGTATAPVSPFVLMGQACL